MMSTLWQNKWRFMGPPMCHKKMHLSLTCVTASAEVPGLVLTSTPRLNGPLIDRRISSQGGGWGGLTGCTGEGAWWPFAFSFTALSDLQFLRFPGFFLLLFYVLKPLCFGRVDSLYACLAQITFILPSVCVIDQIWGQQLISRLMISFKCSKSLLWWRGLILKQEECCSSYNCFRKNGIWVPHTISINLTCYEQHKKLSISFSLISQAAKGKECTIKVTDKSPPCVKLSLFSIWLNSAAAS